MPDPPDPTGADARIEDYALLGDLQTAALVSRDGSVDWLCLPRFDSAACFAALLGGPGAGHWRIAPLVPTAEAAQVTRSYRGDTLVLETVWHTADAEVAVIDFMPPRGDNPDLIRIVEGRRGRLTMRCDLRVRFDYGHVVPWVERRDGRWSAVAGPDALWWTPRSGSPGRTGTPRRCSTWRPPTGCRSCSPGR